jgi:hypothetical protein
VASSLSPYYYPAAGLHPVEVGGEHGQARTPSYSNPVRRWGQGFVTCGALWLVGSAALQPPPVTTLAEDDVGGGVGLAWLAERAAARWTTSLRWPATSAELALDAVRAYGEARAGERRHERGGEQRGRATNARECVSRQRRVQRVNRTTGGRSVVSCSLHALSEAPRPLSHSQR